MEIRILMLRCKGLRSLVFLPHKVQTEENPFKVKVFNKQLNDQDTFQSITKYIQSV